MFRVSPIDTLTARSRGEPSPASLLRVPSVHACGLIGKLARKSADGDVDFSRKISSEGRKITHPQPSHLMHSMIQVHKMTNSR